MAFADAQEGTPATRPAASGGRPVDVVTEEDF
jgi:hypothetical protein